jgi:hypothetical protein
MHRTGTYSSVLASVLLDEGARTLTRSQLARDLATTLVQEARELVRTSRELVRTSRELIGPAARRPGTPTEPRQTGEAARPSLADCPRGAVDVHPSALSCKESVRRVRQLHPGYPDRVGAVRHKCSERSDVVRLQPKAT